MLWRSLFDVSRAWALKNWDMAGTEIPTKITMTAITTISSMSVKPLRNRDPKLMSLPPACTPILPLPPASGNSRSIQMTPFAPPMLHLLRVSVPCYPDRLRGAPFERKAGRTPGSRQPERSPASHLGHGASALPAPGRDDGDVWAVLA